MSRKSARNLDGAFSALSDPTRRKVIELLGRGPQRASELASATDQSRPGMSRHLRLLREAGLVREEEDESDARASLYVLDQQAFEGVKGWLDVVESHWADQLASFKDHVEARAAALSNPKKRARGAR